ncbi:MAG: glycine cleavage system protein GcvH [Rhodospirillales bacterium]|nr:glycine cleavage system protein GcvH [Rhodospirillales bacterium]
MATLKFTDQHEWLSIEDDIARVGITGYAQGQLGDVVFVELPDTGSEFKQGDEAAVVESVKAAAEVYAPAAGDITETNADLESSPELVNSDPHGAGWFFKMRLSDLSETDAMMDEQSYKDFVATLE